MLIFAYDGSTEQEQQIINQKISEGFSLIEVQNVQIGNFLAFIPSDEVIQPLPDKIAQIEAENIELKRDALNMAEIVLDLGIRLQMLEMGV